MPLTIITACFVVTAYLVDDYPYILVISLLFLPFLDRDFKIPALANEVRVLKKYGWIPLVVTCALLLAYPAYTSNYLQELFRTALPEEWFFRGYLLSRIGCNARANIFSSVVFSLFHAITRGPMVALEVFAPSLLFGLIFQKSGSLMMCIFTHATLNVAAITVFEKYIILMRSWLGYLV